MKKMRYVLFLLFFCSFLNYSPTLKAQDFQIVYNILQGNCTNSTCHSASSANPLKFDGTPAQVFANIVDVDPLNPAARAKHNKLIDPGRPYNSFLLRKLGNAHDAYFGLQPSEGDEMPPNGGSPLDDWEVEAVRQWVLYGASPTQNQIDLQLLQDYYNGQGMPMLAPPPKPNASEGFQLRLGPIFLEPHARDDDEVEFLLKYETHLEEPVEVYKFEGFMNTTSHHFLLFNFDDSTAAAAEPEGLRRVTLVTGTAFDGNKSFAGAWQYDNVVELPTNTAFYWEKNETLDLNYHVLNYSTDSILAANFYLNVYYQPQGSGATEMHAELINNPFIFLWPGNNDVTEVYRDNGSADTWNIWSVSSHTHKFGTDYDIFIRNPDGSEGEQIYEGFFNEDYTFNQGFYDWEHPAIRTFSTLKPVSAHDGFIYKTKWNVTQALPVTFGLTAADEMMLFVYLYTITNSSTAIDDEWESSLGFSVYPNPFSGESTISFTLDMDADPRLEIYDLLGKKVADLTDAISGSGKYEVPLRGEQLGLRPGMYLVRLFLNGKDLSRKIILTQ